MVLDKHIQLLEKLYDKTVSGERRWKETFMPGTFQLSFPHYSVQIKILTIPNTPNDRNVENLEILNEDGDIIEAFDTDDIVSANLDLKRIQELTAKFEKLYEEARRQALGADKALDEILENL